MSEPTAVGEMDRTRYHITHYRAELSFDFAQRAVFGTVTLDLTFLRAAHEVVLDAWDLTIEDIVNHDTGARPTHTSTQTRLTLVLDRAYAPGASCRLSVRYHARPKAGMYFDTVPGTPDIHYVCTLGEGGLHANWLPIYAAFDRKFTSEIILTVPDHLTALSNGALVAKTRGDDGMIRWHWHQDLPHSSYLITVNIGDFERVDLQDDPDGLPVGVWVPKGGEACAAWAFRVTPAQIRYYAALFDHPYPWNKYDQVVQPNFPGIGGMEHTGLTAFCIITMRGPENAVDSEGPMFDDYHSVWYHESYLAHELIHQWFGDLVSYRSLAHVWLNEGFASYFMYSWNEHTLGRDRVLFDLENMRATYRAYVAENPARPLEYPDYATPGEAFEFRHAYYKAALTLHMLRCLMGDEAFMAAVRAYLKAHAFGTVTGHGFQLALETSSGMDLGWFFKQWVIGAGHPVLDATHGYDPARKLLQVTVAQIQQQGEGIGLFRLPLRIDIHTSDGIITHRVWTHEARARFYFPMTQAPLLVSLDPEGDLIAEIVQHPTCVEAVYQSEHDRIVGRTRGLRALAPFAATEPEAAARIAGMACDEAFWPLQAEALLLCAHLEEHAAIAALETGLKSSAYRVRKAAVLGLARLGSEKARQVLHRILTEERHENVVGTTIWALAQCSRLSADFFASQLARDAWFDTIRLAALRAMAHQARPEYASLIPRFWDRAYNGWVRDAALRAMEAVAPQDPAFIDTLLTLAESQPPLQDTALELLERLAPSRALPVLARVSAMAGAPDTAAAAAAAHAEISRLDAVAAAHHAPKKED